MTMISPSSFGQSIGQMRNIDQFVVTLDFRDSGMDLSVSASQLEMGQATDALDVRFKQGGFATDYDVSHFSTAYAGAGDKTIMGLANLEKSSGAKYLVRIRPTGWDRWNGTDWHTLSGGPTASNLDRINALNMDEWLVVANGKDRLQRWDGVDGNAVVDLSADAPIAKYITKIGNRMVAAYIKDAGVFDPYRFAWCADGIITDWTTTNLGAGEANPPAEGSTDSPNFITGLSTLQRGVAIYRQSAIQLATLTGAGDAPFRFTTIDFTHGTESPYSLARGGAKLGDFFLGQDYMVYNFDGNGEAIPIGAPIFETLRDSISDRTQVRGAIDKNEQEYHLAFPSSGSSVLNQSWVFSIREFVKRQRLVWRRRTLPANTSAFGYGFLAANADPIVDTITDIVDTITIRVDDWDNSYGPDRILFGDSAGQVWQVDKTTPAPNGKFESKDMVYEGMVVTVDRIRLWYRAPGVATVAVAISTDGGRNYEAERIYSLSPTGTGDTYAVMDHGVTGRSTQFRIRPLTGFCTITRLEATIQNRGRGNG